MQFIMLVYFIAVEWTYKLRIMSFTLYLLCTFYSVLRLKIQSGDPF